MTCGIYQILNKVTGKSYVGSSVNIKSRWGTHKKHLRGGSHHSIKLQRSWNKHESDGWDWRILEECGELILLYREDFWINFLDSVENGYNMININLKDGVIVPGSSEESRNRKSLGLLGRSDEAKTKSLDKLRKTLQSRSKEEKAKRSFSISDEYQNRSEEAKLARALKISRGHQSRSEENKLEAIGKVKATKQSYTEEQKEQTSKRISEQYHKKTKEAKAEIQDRKRATIEARPEKEAARVAKILATKRARTSEKQLQVWQNLSNGRLNRSEEQKAASAKKSLESHQNRSPEAKAKTAEKRQCTAQKKLLRKFPRSFQFLFQASTLGIQKYKLNRRPNAKALTPSFQFTFEANP